MQCMLNSKFVSTDVQHKMALTKYSKSKTDYGIQIRTGVIFKFLIRSWCVTLKNACGNSPLRLYCFKVLFSGCDAALYWIYKCSGSPLLTAATRATQCTRTLSHWHMDGTQAMSKGLKPSGPESHTSIVLVASNRCRTLQQLSTSPSFLFLFF